MLWLALPAPLTRQNYEAMGIDAVIAAEFGGMWPLGEGETPASQSGLAVMCVMTSLCVRVRETCTLGKPLHSYDRNSGFCGPIICLEAAPCTCMMVCERVRTWCRPTWTSYTAAQLRQWRAPDFVQANERMIDHY